MWLIFALVFSAAFQSTLTTTLIVPKYNPNINTIAELLNTDFSIYASTFDKDLLQQNLDKANMRLLDKVVGGNIWTIDSMLKKQGNNGFLVRSEIARQFVSMTRDKDTGAASYHIVEEHPVPCAQAYQLLRKHPYYEEMLWIVNKVHESGIYFRWRETNFGWTEKFINLSSKQYSNMEVSKFEPLSVLHLQSAFYFMLLGMGFAFVAFIIERTWKQRNSTSN